MHTRIFSVSLAALLLSSSMSAASSLLIRPEDPRSVLLAPGQFGAVADGTADDSAAIQAAIDRARQGVIFVAQGRYRITRTIFLWPGIRLMGYGASRPVFVLAPNSPGYQKGVGTMLTFAGARAGGGPPAGPGAPPPAANPPAAAPGAARGASAGRGFPGGGRGAFRVPFPPPDSVPPNPNITDANQNTFYSAISNLDFEIGDGNPAAVAVRFHPAQHCYLAHMDFRVGSGLAAIIEVGNYAHDLHISGGRYGILTDMTSPSWPFTLVDSEFQGQRESAIRSHNAGITLIHDTFRDVPTGIETDAQDFDRVWSKDCRFQNLRNAAMLISSEQNPLNQISFENAVLSQVPVFARFRESGKTVAGKGALYRVASFNHGLVIPGEGRTGTIGTLYSAAPLTAMPAVPGPAIPALPPTSEWVNVHTLGVTGDRTTDDTAAIRKAIEQHRVLYFPAGQYLVSDTLALKPDTVMIGLHPSATQIVLADNTPAFAGAGTPVAVIEAPAGGANILSGVGIATNGVNPRAVGILWRSGAASLIDDVRMMGPVGGNSRWESQNPSIWVTQGGGGNFTDIWTPNTNAKAGFFVSDTKTPGRVYELSTEHHVHSEIKLDHVENWEFYGPQTEEEAAESPESLSLEIASSKNITFANYHAYRVARSRAPYPAAVRVYDSSDIHFRNVRMNSEHGYAVCDQNGCGTFVRAGKFPYENSVEDVTHRLTTRERQFAVLDIPASPVAPVAATGPKPRKLEDGFFSISGAAVDRAGKLYFVDHHDQRIYGWSQAERLTIERDNPLDAVNLAFDNAGDLLVFSSAGPEGTLYSFHPGSPKSELTVISPQAAQSHPAARIILPVNYWNDGQFKSHLDPETLASKTLAKMFEEDVGTPKSREYVSPDGSVVLPAFRVFQQGPADSPTGWRFSDTLDAHGFVVAAPGDRIYVSNSSEDKTYRATVKPDGTLADLQPFANRGGECVAVDANGNVYVANGQVFVYDRTGKLTREIDVPERPIDIVFGGPDRKTLFILTHHALYAL